MRAASYSVVEFQRRFPGFKVPDFDKFGSNLWSEMMWELNCRGLIIYPNPAGEPAVLVPDYDALVKEHSLVLLKNFDESDSEKSVVETLRESIEMALGPMVGSPLDASTIMGIQNEVERVIQQTVPGCAVDVACNRTLSSGEIQLDVKVHLPADPSAIKFLVNLK